MVEGNTCLETFPLMLLLVTREACATLNRAVCADSIVALSVVDITVEQRNAQANRIAKTSKSERQDIHRQPTAVTGILSIPSAVEAEPLGVPSRRARSIRRARRDCT
eukprot:2399546-Prymnesium_polylepis.1